MNKSLVKEAGFYGTDQVNHLDENSILFQQRPFVIGLSHAIPINCLYTMIENCTSQEFVHVLKKGLASNISFERLIPKLKRKSTASQFYELAKCIKEFDQTDYANLAGVEIIHLGKNKEKDQCTEPTQKTIQNMVKRFINNIYNYGKLVKVIKHLMLSDITQILNNIILTCNAANLSSTRNSLFKQTLQQINRFVKESFALSFNGSKYDLILILQAIYTYKTQNKQCRVRTFRKGSTYSSCTVSWIKSKKNWSQQFVFKDVRNLTEQNCSLELLSKRFGVPNQSGKGTFPHSANCSVRWLKETQSLPNFESQEWNDVLKNCKPTQEAVNQAQQDFQLIKAENLYEYLIFYLKVKN